MNREEVLNMIDGGHLAHYGIKGQKWGDRRFQNEDGTLTPEGRRRYGLKPDYSNMTDKELQEAISTKRTQNQYVDLMTEGPRKKRQEISSFVNAASSAAKSANSLADKTILESKRSAFQAEADYYKSRNQTIDEQLKTARKANDQAQILSLEAEKKANKESIDYYTGAKKSADSVKGVVDTAVGIPGQFSDEIGKISTKEELEEKTAEAYRNINEMNKDQLKKTVDRMMLEKQYDELVNPPKPSRWEKGREVIQTLGSVLAIAATAAGLIWTIKKIKGNSISEADEDGEYLAHYGVKGMKKGDRRYQNEDGSLTPEGYRHYGIDPNYRRGLGNNKEQNIAKQKLTNPLADQKAKQKLANQKMVYKAKQRAYTEKIARRKAIRDAKDQAALESIRRRQQIRDEQYQEKARLETQRERMRAENEAKAENRKDIRKNVVKGVAAVAAIAAVLYVGRHVLRERALNNAHVRDIDKINTIHRNNIQQTLTEAKAYNMRTMSDISKIKVQGQETRALELTKGKQSLSLERMRGKNAIGLERANASKLKSIERIKGKNAIGLEAQRGRTLMGVERIKGRNASGLERIKGRNAIKLEATKGKNLVQIEGFKSRASYDSGRLSLYEDMRLEKIKASEAAKAYKAKNADMIELNKLTSKLTKGGVNNTLNIGGKTINSANVQAIASAKGVENVKNLQGDSLAKKLRALLKLKHGEEDEKHIIYYSSIGIDKISFIKGGIC